MKPGSKKAKSGEAGPWLKLCGWFTEWVIGRK